MSKNINQITTAAASILATDKLYLGRSPFGITDDRYILGSSIISQFSPLTTKGDIYTYSTAATRLAVAVGDGKILQVSSAAATGLAWSTPTYPSASGTAGQILRSNGTNNLYSTSTFADTYAVSTILYASSANVISGLATANSGVLITSAGGVPSISSTLPTAVQSNITQLGAQAAALNMNTHLINNVVDPVSAQDAATKNYVDQTALNGTTVYAASAGSLGTVTQSGAGVGATLTNAGAQATFALDGVNPPVGSNVLIKNTATGMTSANEGIYTVTSVGSGASNWILTRASSYDSTTEINNTGLIVIQNGSTLSGTAWYNAATIVTVDTTAFSYAEFGNIVFPITLANGGTGAAITASNGGIFYSNASTGALLSGTATAGLALLSGASTTPTWSTKPPITQVNVQVITTTGSSTYTPTTGMKFCIVELVGGGGGGGGASQAGGQSSAGGGGGGAGYVRKTYTAALLGANATVVVGTGGAGGSSGANPGSDGADSTFTPAGAGAVLTAGKGGGGGAGTSSASINVSSGGSRGFTVTGGDLNIQGMDGTGGFALASATLGVGGQGGIAGAYGAGAVAVPGNSAQSAATGQNYGSGGGGCVAIGSNQAGGNGAQGVCYITEFISV